MKGLNLAFGVLFLGLTNLHATVLDSGFSEAVYASGMSSVTGMGWAPDGSNRLFVTQQNGVVRIVQNGTLQPTAFTTISPINTSVQAGLLGFCFDPNFAVNHYVYFFVTVSGSEQQIIRLTDTNSVGANKTVVFSGLPVSSTANQYEGGGIGFGFDGKLYWAIGESPGGVGVNGNLTSLTAKVGRANLNGTVPSDNPYAGAGGSTNRYIWARGLRNPFKMTFNPYNGSLWVDTPGDTYEQIFLVQKNDNAGWDTYENNQPAGFITPKIKFADAGVQTFNIVASTGAVRNNNVVTFATTATHGLRQGEKITIASVGNSSFNGTFYIASVPSGTTFTVNQSGSNATSGGGTASTQDLGGAVTGCCFYTGTLFPVQYRTNYFFCDYVDGRINRAGIDANNNVVSVDYFANNIVNAIDVSTGPDGALYYVNFGGTVYRTTYTSPPQGFVVSPTGLNMAEGGQAVFSVRLAAAPASPVNVTITRSSGDADLNVTNASLTFTSTNFSVPQSVRIVSTIDADFQNDTAQFSVSASGFTNQTTVFVNAYEVQGNPVFTSVTRSNGVTQIRLSGGVGQTYVLDGATNLPSWVPIATNVAITNTVTFSDSSTNAVRRRFYRARSQ